MKKLILSLLVITLIAIGIYFFTQSENAPVTVTDSAQSTAKDKDSDFKVKNPDPVEKTPEYDISSESSLQVVVNKSRPISLAYIPESLVSPNVALTGGNWQLRLEASEALEKMFGAAEAEQVGLVLGSAYRSSATQTALYDSYVSSFGQAEADRFSAKPGTSEHQLGLAADISSVTGTCFLEICYEDTIEGKWIEQNAHLYGYVVRYPKGAEAITGYQYEPWHIRYVGNELSLELYSSGQTIEEYFNL